MAGLPFQKLDKRPCVFFVAVFPFDEGVLKIISSARFLKIIIALVSIGIIATIALVVITILLYGECSVTTFISNGR